MYNNIINTFSTNKSTVWPPLVHNMDRYNQIYFLIKRNTDTLYLYNIII